MASEIDVLGTVTEDGNLKLDQPLELPPGRVRVKVVQATERLPDPPLEDVCISAPFDLPYENEGVPIDLGEGEERLPEPWIFEENEE